MKKRLLYELGLWIEVDEYRDGRYGARGKKRKEKREVTPEQIKRQNQFNRTKRLRRRMRANFKEGDLYWTFTFDKKMRPGTMKEAKGIFKYLREEIRKICRAQGKQFKWVVRIERGSRGALHVHLAMNAIEKPRQIVKLWKDKLGRRYGHAYLEFMYEEGGFADLAAYMTKPEEEGEEVYWSHSRNLPMPEPEVEMVKDDLDNRGDIEIPEGYYLDKSSVIEGINPVTGYPFRHYTLVRIRGEDKAA